MQVMPRLALIVFVALAVAAPAWAEDWRPLFNGKDLTGWRANFGADSFSVVDGVLKANSTGRCPHLFFVGSDPDSPERFKDFELKATVRGEPSSNSGIYFHTSEKTRDKKGHLADGYEVQLNTTKKEKRKTGSLYAVQDLAESPIKDQTQWFEVHITVRGKRITVALNGEKVVDYTEPANPERPKERRGRVLNPKGGAIALQAHDPKSTFYFKEILIRRLD